jgi:hypothetical protein
VLVEIEVRDLGRIVVGGAGRDPEVDADHRHLAGHDHQLVGGVGVAHRIIRQASQPPVATPARAARAIARP